MGCNVRHRTEISEKYNGFRVSSLIYTKSRRSIHRKPIRTRCPCLYYANSSGSRQILLHGDDVSVNPGPPAKQKSANREECEKTIRRNQQSVTCSICLGLRHIKCAKLKSIISDWTCGSIEVVLSRFCPYDSFSIEDEFNDPADVYTNLILKLMGSTVSLLFIFFHIL